MPEGPSRYAEVLEQRITALERVFGRRTDHIHSPIPFYLDGDPTVLGFHHHVEAAVVYCTSEMTGGWGSGQKPGPLGEYELAIVLPETSHLGPRRREGLIVEKGWSGVLLCGYAKYSREAVLVGGETSGPLPEAFAPFTQILFFELGRSKIAFEFGGQRYGLLLLCLITESEFAFKKEHGSDALVTRLRKAGAFPVSDAGRQPVA